MYASLLLVMCNVVVRDLAELRAVRFVYPSACEGREGSVWRWVVVCSATVRPTVLLGTWPVIKIECS